MGAVDKGGSLPPVKPLTVTLRKPVVAGVAGGVLLVVFYLAVVSLAQGFSHSMQQLASQWYWIVLLALGFGVQVGLFSYIRQTTRQHRQAATGFVAGSGGLSAGSMLACCAHHLSDLLPVFGLSAAAGFLVRYQTFFLVAGVLSNAVGITVMLDVIQRHGLCPWVGSWKLRVATLKRGLLVSSAVVLAVVLLLSWRTAA